MDIVSHNALQEPLVKSILDPSFRYTKSVETDIRKTFARVRREQRKLAQAASSTAESRATKVVPLRLRNSGV